MADGIKNDKGKPKVGMVVSYFAKALIEVAKCGTFGCEKYGNGEFWDYNWNQVENGYSRYTDALLRHLLKEGDEVYDPDTKLHHAAHVAWNALARLELIMEDIEKDEECTQISPGESSHVRHGVGYIQHNRILETE